HPRLPGRHALARRHARPIQEVGFPHGAEIGRADRARLRLGRPCRPGSAGDDRAPLSRARTRRTSDSHRRPVRACARGAHGEGPAGNPRDSPLPRASFRRASRSQVCEILSFREGSRVSTTTLNEQSVLDALKQVKYPGFSRDIVSFGFIKDLAVGGGNVSFRLALTSDAPAAAEAIKQQCDAALRAIPGVTSVTISVQAAPPQAPVMSGAIGRKDILTDTRFVVAVASGKGGVGKSTVAANLALALKKLGYEVGLMDSDIYGPSQQMMMGITTKPFVNEEEKILPIERFGVRVMSIGFLMDVDTPVIWRGPMIFKAVEQFLGDVAWGKQDFLLVDLPPGTGDAQLTQKVALSGAVIVTTPQDVALIDARK